MNPIITKRYLQTPQQFVKLYWWELVRQHWVLLFIFPGIFIGHIINTFKSGWFYQGLLTLAITLFLFLVACCRFICSIKKNPAYQYPRRLKVYADKLVIEESNGSQNVFSFDQIARVKVRRNDYFLKLKSRNMFWVPKSAFKNEADRSVFERMVKAQ